MAKLAVSELVSGLGGAELPRPTVGPVILESPQAIAATDPRAIASAKMCRLM